MAGRNRLSEWLRRGGADSATGSARPTRPPRSSRSARSARGGLPAGPAPERDEMTRAAAGAGYPVAPAAHPDGFGCSCDRVGCPIPGLHPISPAWQTQATTDPQKIDHWLRTNPLANFVTATGAEHDVLDVPADAGRLALERLTADAATLGPVAALGEERLLFFTLTRATADEDEWWPCALDSNPETPDEHPGIRWHTRGSYVLLPPSRMLDGTGVTWLDGLGPDLPLPDPLPVLDILADACAQVADDEEAEDGAENGAEAAGRRR
ncbi:bifunctional DNA primase/polymerase [Actinacidiphila acididurans]|uniref:Bifunctional DNA primase/polymerase n=1 Tax=Actinacidiphila acididurans TaxID=2784346 RepID=A0ABS2TPT9_9ACTN|nr:bifunctional DNA primase/polymerase [Actinacidiphila acididurans]MBM9505349.1 bifunctional DNA primase/polymerase [Actinacidiphila acididurans]